MMPKVILAIIINNINNWIMNRFNSAINQKQIMVFINVCKLIKKKIVLSKWKELCLLKIVDKANKWLAALSQLIRIMKFEIRLLEQWMRAMWIELLILHCNKLIMHVCWNCYLILVNFIIFLKIKKNLKRIVLINWIVCILKF